MKVNGKPTNRLRAGEVTSDLLAPGAVTTEKILAGAVNVEKASFVRTEGETTVLDGAASLDAGYGQFGSAFHGTVVITANTTLGENKAYDRVTIAAGVVVDTNGWMINARTRVTLGNGAVAHCDGNDASGATGGAARTARALGGSAKGADGSLTTGLGGDARADGYGGNGGAGGANGNTGPAGAGGTVTNPDANLGSIHVLPFAITGRLANGLQYHGGAGGGSGGGDGTNNSGGGGGGGGVLIISTPELVMGANSRISVRGGRGGNGTGGNSSGGGGGGGGYIGLNIAKLTKHATASITAGGGVGGAASGNGASGNSGADGFVNQLGFRADDLSPFAAFEYDFYNLSAGSAATIPGGMQVLRGDTTPSGRLTVQTGDATLVSGIGGSTAGSPSGRVGRLSSAHRLGLLIEETRQNLHNNAREKPEETASNATITQDSHEGPDGQRLADHMNVASGGHGTRYGPLLAPNADPVVSSMWVRHATGSGPYAHTEHATRAGSPDIYQIWTGTVDTTWRFIKLFAVTPQTGDSVNIYFADGRDQSANGGLAAGARDVVVDLYQLEFGKFPTSTMVTDAVNTNGLTRSAEQWSEPDAPARVHDGRLTATFELHPLGTWDEYTAPMRLWTAGSNYAEISHTTRKLKVVVGANTWEPTTPLPTWVRGDRLEIHLAVGASLQSTCKVRVNGGTVVDLGYSDNAQGNISASTITWLCNGNSNQFSAFCPSIKVWPQGEGPLWAL